MDDLNSLLQKNKKAIAIVAHPDDETIWMGGCFLLYDNIDWTIFSVCRSSDTDRAPKFKRVCEHYGAKCIITDLDDEDKLDMKEATKEVEKLILRSIEGKKFDYIFTHGENGEYGHKRHIAVNHAINNLLKSKQINPEAIFYFNYKNDERHEHKVESGEDSNLLLDLSKNEYKEKKRIVSQMHGYPMDGIDVGYCTNPESFKVKILNKY